jgi:hypothetical protein
MENLGQGPKVCQKKAGLERTRCFRTPAASSDDNPMSAPETNPAGLMLEICHGAARWLAAVQRSDGSTASASESGADRGKRAADALTEVTDDPHDRHDDQGQHHRVFDGRRTVFTRQELSNSGNHRVHGILL